MRPQKSGVVLLAFVISVLVATIAVAKAPRGFAVRTDLPRAPAFWLAVGAVAQDPAGVEASLGLDRPTRRLIQQGLRNEGFDPGAPDGLFGPRTRTAIRRWQEARGVRPTGYLGSAEVELLRAAALPVPPVVQPQSPPRRRRPHIAAAGRGTIGRFFIATYELRRLEHGRLLSERAGLRGDSLSCCRSRPRGTRR